MSNKWIEKVKLYNQKHPELSYKECLIKLSNKKQKGGNPALLAVAQNSGAIADNVAKIISAITNAINEQQKRGFDKNVMTGWYDLRKRFKNERIIEDRTIKLYNKYRKLRDNGQFPPWSDNQIWLYAEQNL